MYRHESWQTATLFAQVANSASVHIVIGKKHLYPNSFSGWNYVIQSISMGSRSKIWNNMLCYNDLWPRRNWVGRGQADLPIRVNCFVNMNPWPEVPNHLLAIVLHSLPCLLLILRYFTHISTPTVIENVIFFSVASWHRWCQYQVRIPTAHSTPNHPTLVILNGETMGNQYWSSGQWLQQFCAASKATLLVATIFWFVPEWTQRVAGSGAVDLVASPWFKRSHCYWLIPIDPWVKRLTFLTSPRCFRLLNARTILSARTRLSSIIRYYKYIITWLEPQ